MGLLDRLLGKKKLQRHSLAGRSTTNAETAGMIAPQEIKKKEDVADVDGLAKLLEDENEDIRKKAVYKLADIANPSAIASLIQALNDKSPEVRSRAAYALGERKALTAIEPLKRLLEDRYWEVRRASAEALAELGEGQHLSRVLGVDPLIVQPAKNMDYVEIKERFVRYQRFELGHDCVALFVFNSNEISNKLDMLDVGTYGVYVQRELLKAWSRGMKYQEEECALNRISPSYISEGDLFESEVASLQSWLTVGVSGDYRINAGLADPDFINKVKLKQELGYVPHTLCIGPISWWFAIAVDKGLRDMACVGYLGVLIMQMQVHPDRVSRALHLVLDKEIKTGLIGWRCKGWTVTKEILREVGMEGLDKI